MRKRWSKAEVTHLERHAANTGLEELAQKFHVDTDTVRRKLEALGLTAGGGQKAGGDDGALESYGEALRLLHEKQWEDAAALFEQVIAGSDNLQIVDRARQNLATCRRRSAENEGMDPYLEAVVEKNRGNVEAALELCMAQSKQDDDERYAYLLASLHSLAGSAEQALEHLEIAIRLEPKNRIHAYHDPDFDELRGEEEFTDLVASPGS